ncbi:MAG: SCP2 sterol-binding domain-containing protein [Actinomycetota bacterium]|nr:SCP2 sterol-binding domain-containing protein [Actinomycetota bacterium]
MAEWLSPAWVEESTRAIESWPFAGEAPPAPVALTVTVTGGPQGDATYVRHWWPAHGVEERALALTVAFPEARALLAGQVSPSVAFMRGRLKTSGDHGAALDVLAASSRPPFAEILARMRSVTS